jgi:acetaldehyde dehydrogenase / alcohol dehydrogenase
VLRIGGKGHSAAIHSTSPATIMAYGAALDVLRIAVNAGSSLGSSGIETGLAPAMTIGTGFFGRSALGENLQPKHLVQWTRLACNSDPAEAFGNFAGLDPWQAPAGSVPPYPVASNLAGAGPGTHPAAARGPELDSLRAEIRRVVLAELRALTGGDGRG